MKVVLFCGGLGMRMRADNQSLPKPMMPIGSRPVLWHIMRYFAHFGHTGHVAQWNAGYECKNRRSHRWVTEQRDRLSR